MPKGKLPKASKRRYQTPGAPVDPAITPAQPVKRNADGTFQKGYAASVGADAARARRRLNITTIEGMQRAYDRGGQKAIDQVMREQPAIFLKMLVLLVPRELEITQTGGVKAMSDEQLEAAIAAIESMVARRVAGADAKVIEGSASATPAAADTPSANTD